MKEDRPSATAYLIARSTLFLSRDPILGRLVPERSAELSKRFVQTRSGFARFLDAAFNSRLLRPLTICLERATVPGIKLHYALRKRYLEEIAREALSTGISQLVVIGAGFDTLALRLHEAFPKARFFEIDHPATQRVKKRVAESQSSTENNLKFISLDLEHGNLETCLLTAPEYRPDADTLFIAEGLLMYLAPAEIDLMLQLIRCYSGPKSRFAFTFMETQLDGRIGFQQSSPVVDLWLRLRGESFKWGIHRTGIKEFLAARGFNVLEIVTSGALRNSYLTTEPLRQIPLAKGECICVAEPDRG